MQSGGARSLWTLRKTIVVVGFAAVLAGCASAGPLSAVPISDIKSVAGTWKGVVYHRSGEPENIELTIREDGSYDVVSRHPRGESRTSGKVEPSNGRLVMQGERGRGLGTVLSSPGGDRVMGIEVTLSDNSILSTRLWPSP
jgi:hypothetical protein